MAPKVKINKDEIVSKALELVRSNGADSLNARIIAKALGCSTQPIFSNFAAMDELQRAVIIAAYELYSDFLKNESESEKYTKYKAYGMAYIRFAREEKQLFKLLFMRDRSNEDISYSPDFEESVRMIMSANDTTHEKATLFHLELWSFVHGIATMLATSFLELEEALISDMLSDVYQGLCSRLLSEDK